jgi:translation elongation factor EF-Tu-like GTPase
MTELKPDIIASLYVLSTSEGGRKSPIVASMFGCTFEHGSEKNDCRLLLEGKGDVWPGQQISVPIKFLFPELVRPRLQVGDSFRLLEGRVIAHGTVEEIGFE